MEELESLCDCSCCKDNKKAVVGIGTAILGVGITFFGHYIMIKNGCKKM